jgi:hypothetical protein
VATSSTSCSPKYLAVVSSFVLTICWRQRADDRKACCAAAEGSSSAARAPGRVHIKVLNSRYSQIYLLKRAAVMAFSPLKLAIAR